MTDSNPDQNRSVESPAQQQVRPELVAASLRHKTSTLVQHTDLLAAKLENSEENPEEMLDTAWMLTEILEAMGNLTETAHTLDSDWVEE